MMLTVTCSKCGEMYSLRGWIVKEDLKGTDFETKIDTISDEELKQLEEMGKVKDEVNKFYDNPICKYCGSKKVSYL